MAPRMVWPLPTHQIDPFLKDKRVVLVPEVNYTGQFAQLLKTHYQNVEFTRLNVYGGQPFSVARIVEPSDQQRRSSNGTLEPHGGRGSCLISVAVTPNARSRTTRAT